MIILIRLLPHECRHLLNQPVIYSNAFYVLKSLQQRRNHNKLITYILPPVNYNDITTRHLHCRLNAGFMDEIGDGGLSVSIDGTHTVSVCRCNTINVSQTLPASQRRYRRYVQVISRNVFILDIILCKPSRSLIFM